MTKTTSNSLCVSVIKNFQQYPSRCPYHSKTMKYGRGHWYDCNCILGDEFHNDF